MVEPGDIFPERKLGQSEPWGRSIEEAIRQLQRDTFGVVQSVQGAGRASSSGQQQAQFASWKAEAAQESADVAVEIAQSARDGNLISNPGFERGSEGWIPLGAPEADPVVVAGGRSGENALQVTGGTRVGTGPISVIPGRTYRVSYWIRHSGDFTPNPDSVFRVGFIHDPEEPGSWSPGGIPDNSPFNLDPAADWKQFSEDWEVPDDFQYRYVFLRIAASENAISSGEAYLDDFFMSDITTEESVQSALQKADEALQEAAQATETADGKNAVRASVSEPDYDTKAPGDLWYVLDSEGRVVGVRVWNGEQYNPYEIVADSVLVPGSVGAAQIADGAITAPKIQVGSIDLDRLTSGTHISDVPPLESGTWELVQSPVDPSSTQTVVVPEGESSPALEWDARNPVHPNGPSLRSDRYEIPDTDSTWLPLQIQDLGDENGNRTARVEIRREVIFRDSQGVIVDSSLGSYTLPNLSEGWVDLSVFLNLEDARYDPNGGRRWDVTMEVHLTLTSYSAPPSSPAPDGNPLRRRLLLRQGNPGTSGTQTTLQGRRVVTPQVYADGISVTTALDVGGSAMVGGSIFGGGILTAGGYPDDEDLPGQGGFQIKGVFSGRALEMRLPEDHPDAPPNGDLTKFSSADFYAMRQAVNETFPAEIAEAKQGVNPPGVILPYAASTAPSGWLLCHGQAVSRSTYSRLFNVIGTTYGSGNGSSTFNLPDMRGRVPAGRSTTDSDFTLGTSGGEKEVTLTEGQMPQHSHQVHSDASTYVDIGGGTPTSQSGYTRIPGGAPVSGSRYTGSASGSSPSRITFYGTSRDAGGGEPHTNLQPYLSLSYIIKT